MNIGFIGEGIGPVFNEAGANHVRDLCNIFNGTIVTWNDIGFSLLKRTDNSWILNGKFIYRDYPILHDLNGALCLLMARTLTFKFNIIYLIDLIDNRWFKYMPLEKSIHPITANLKYLNEYALKNYVKNIAPRLGGIVAQTKTIEDQLINLGISPGKIHVIYPAIDLQKFQDVSRPDIQQFRIAFASSPTVKDKGYDYFFEKGVPILLKAFKEFSGIINSKLYLLWRNVYKEELGQLIKELRLEKDVIIYDRTINMPELYNKIHATIIPYISLNSSPDFPSSAIESLACGKPVITTTTPEMYRIIQQEKCGSVAKPTKEDLVGAMINCYENYNLFRNKCRFVAEKYFNIHNEANKLEEIHKSISYIKI